PSSAPPPPWLTTPSLHDALPIFAQQELLGGGQAGAEPHGHAEVLQHHLDPREPAEQVELVETPEVADAEHLATDRAEPDAEGQVDRKSTRLNSSHVAISYAVFCL